MTSNMIKFEIFSKRISFTSGFELKTSRRYLSSSRHLYDLVKQDEY